MKTKLCLSENWELLKIIPAESIDPENIVPETGRVPAGWIPVKKMPSQVHDVLIDEGYLPEEIRIGWCESAKWTGDYDWVYRCHFDRERAADTVRLFFGGLDTVADIYLNGVQMGSHDNFYLPQTIDITRGIAEHNTLLIHFHNIEEILDKLILPKEWEKTVLKFKMLRKPKHDIPAGVTEGAAYQGAVPYFEPIGIFQPVFIEYADSAEFTWDHIIPSVKAPYKEAGITITLKGINGDKVKIVVRNPNGQIVASAEETVSGTWRQPFRLAVKEPVLWNPRGFGGQARYTVEMLLTTDGQVSDRMEKKIGFREVVQDGDLGFRINGKTVRLWGGSMDPFQDYTHCWNSKRVVRILDMIENANMNTLRIWGEGVPYEDELYEEADKRGILIWQEFYLGNGAYPNNPEFREACRQEAIYLILRLRWRPSLLMWCGGNETIMGSEYIDRDMHAYGSEMVLEDFPALVDYYDNGRLYFPNSPYGGEWANDPRVGDFHIYDGVWAYPYAEYPNFIGEDIRCAPPVMHSLKRMIKGELWPEGYSGKLTHRDRFPMPDSWMQRSHYSAMGHIKTGPYWEYYEADTPEDHLYRFAAAAGQSMRRCIERVRQGSKNGDVPVNQRIKGHFACKLLDTWPKVYCAIIDFFQEGFHSYYATAAAQRPIALSFQMTPDGYRLWLANDSDMDAKGEVTFGMFDMEKNEFVLTDKVDAEMLQGHSGIVLNLDKYKFFWKTLVLYATFTDKEHGIYDRINDFADVERHYRFPDAKLKVMIEGDELVISTDTFARCIEITAKNEETEFGWLFSDNYFDLLPGEVKRVGIVAGGSAVINVKPHYAKAVEVNYNEAYRCPPPL
jgi:beta-mannosidase